MKWLVRATFFTSSFYHIDLDHHNAGSDSHACGELLLTMMDEGADIQQFIKTYYF